MTPPNQPPRPTKPVQGAEIERVVGVAQRQAKARGGAPDRRATNPAIEALKAPPLPAEADQFVDTMPAPRGDAPTLKVTPPSGTPAQDDGARSADRRQVEVLLLERQEAQQRIAELERRERVRGETAVAQFPPQIVEAGKSAAPSSGKFDKAIGKGVRFFLMRLASRFGLAPLLIALGLGGAGVAVWKPAADPAKVDAQAVTMQALGERVDVLEKARVAGIKQRAEDWAYIECLEEGLDEVGTQLLPRPDRQMAPDGPLRPWVNKCKGLRPKDKP